MVNYFENGCKRETIETWVKTMCSDLTSPSCSLSSTTRRHHSLGEERGGVFRGSQRRPVQPSHYHPIG